MTDMENLHPAGRMLAERLNSLLAIRGKRDPATGRIQPLSTDQLYLMILDNYGQPEFSIRHLERCVTGYAKPNVETIWLLAETLGVRPAYFLGGDL